MQENNQNKVEKKGKHGGRMATRRVAVCAVLLTFILVFVLVPIQILPIDVAFIPLLAVFIACQVEGGKTGLFIATSFGLASLLAAFVRPTLLSPIFYNPMVSVFPRICIGITCYLSYVGLRRACVAIGIKRNKPLNLRMSILVSSSLSAVIGVLTNTGLVFAMIAAFNWGKSIGGIYVNAAFFSALITVNFLIEICVAAFITPFITLALRRTMRLSEPEDALIKESHDAYTV